MNIVAIGGGQLALKETLPLDQMICKLAKKTKPRALFIPTASQDAPGYCEDFDKIYGDQLGCYTEHLYLCRQQDSLCQIEQKIKDADLIYVGGGNTYNMMKVWRDKGVDKMLTTAAQQGTVMAGLSAGAICWFHTGLSDPDDSTNALVDGLGLLPEFFCPHIDSEQYRNSFQQFMQTQSTPGVGADDCAAIWFHQNRYTVLTAKPSACVSVYQPSNDGIRVLSFKHREQLPIGEQN